MFDSRELDLWIENDLNVLFEGRHGVGKTAMVVEAFDKHKLEWKYFSAATMDPWVDFVGIPKDSTDDNGDQVIDLIRPRGFHNGSVEAIFMDELNRAPKKVRNAVMELIQFKSINGVKFPNLRFVWAAINPEDEEDSDLRYDVDALDPAQKDRFHICVDIPYKPVAKYFTGLYGDAGTGAVEWWHGLSAPHQELVSPRRLEYAIKVWQMGGSVRHVLKHKELGSTALITRLEAGSIKKKLMKLLKATPAERDQVFSNMNFVTDALPLILRNERMISHFAQYIPKDIMSGLILKGDKTSRKIASYAPSSITGAILKSVVETNGLPRKKAKSLGKHIGVDIIEEYFPEEIPKSRPTTETYTEMLLQYYKQTNHCTTSNSTHQRLSALTDVCETFETKADLTSLEGLIIMLMFLSSIVGRTQAATMNRNGNPVPTMCHHIKLMVASKARSEGYFFDELWKAVKTELSAPLGKKLYARGKGMGKQFEGKELAKIETYLGP